MSRPAPALTLAQRVRRIPNCPGWLYTDVMRAPGDLRIANRVPAFWGGKEQRRQAMRQMATVLNALRRAEKAAGFQFAR